VPVAKRLGDYSLESKGQDVGGLAGVIVQAVADPVEKIETLAQFVTGVGGENAAGAEFLKVPGIEEGIGDPQQVVEVAHASRALLQIGFLQEHGG